jgi:hypothetical protein
MYGIKNNNGKTIRGMWTNLLDARARACQLSHLDNYIWKVVSGDQVLCLFQNGKEIIQDLSKEERELATAIHGKLCRYNHEDQCDWFYGDRWDQEFTAKHEYLKKARAMLDNGIELNQAMKVITNL